MIILNTSRFLTFLILIFLFGSSVVIAQQKSSQDKAQQSASDSDENTVNPRQISVSNPADFLKPGTLQVEYDYSGYYHGDDFRAQDTGILTVSYAANDRIGLEADFTTVTSQKALNRHRETGVGDVNLGVQLDLINEDKSHPGFAMAYYVKLPSASAEKNLGSGRVDHQITALISKKFSGTEIDFNASYLINGREDSKGFVTGGQYVLSASRDFHKKFNLQAEIFDETKDAGDPRGLFADGIFTYYANSKTAFSIGGGFGLTHSTPRAKFTAGIAYAFDNPFKKHK